MTAHQYPDRARRCSDAVTLAMLAEGRDVVGRWLAVRLSDGAPSRGVRNAGAIYDTKGDAVRHQLHPHQCAYVCIPPEGMTPRQAHTYLTFIEGLYAAGADLADPDRQVQIPAAMERVPGLIRAIKRERLI